MRLLTAATLIFAGCRGASATCPADTEALRTLLVQAASQPPSQFHIVDEQLVVRTDLPRKEQPHAPSVTLTPERTRSQGVDYTTDKLQEHLAKAHAQIQEDIELGRTAKNEKPDPRRVRFVIDGRTPWSKVVAAVDAAIAADMTALGFVFAVPRVPPPPSTDIEAKIKANPDSLAQLTRELLEGCPLALEAFVPQDDDENTSFAIAERVPTVLARCGCSVDMARVRSALFLVLAESRPTRALDLDPDAPAETIEFPGDTLWSAASAKLTATTKNVRFHVSRR